MRSPEAEDAPGTRAVLGSGVVFYVVIFSACAVLLVIGGLTVWSRNRRTLEAEKRDESAGAHERRQKNKAERSQSRKGRRKRR